MILVAPTALIVLEPTNAPFSLHPTVGFNGGLKPAGIGYGAWISNPGLVGALLCKATCMSSRTGVFAEFEVENETLIQRYP